MKDTIKSFLHVVKPTEVLDGSIQTFFLFVYLEFLLKVGAVLTEQVPLMNSKALQMSEFCKQ
jgi:hypothetical protein